MIAQYDVLFTGQMVFALTALLGLVSLGIKVFARKSADHRFVNESEFHEFKRDIARQIEALRSRIDHQFECVLQKLDEHKNEMLISGDARSQALHDRLNDLQSDVARLDERTK